MCQAVKGSDRKNLVVCRKIIVFKCEIETRRMDILCIFVSAEKLNFILNPFTPSSPSLSFDVKNFTGRFKIQNLMFVSCQRQTSQTVSKSVSGKLLFA